MLIDWFTVIAQAVNFLILVWLLKRFLYVPILNAIDAREMRISSELADASAQKDLAQRECDEFRDKNQEFDRQRASLLGEATLSAKAERYRLLEDVRKEAEGLRTRQMESLRNDYQNLKEEIVRRTRDEVFAIARKTLGDLAGVSLEDHIVDIFIRQCRGLEEEKKNELQAVFKTSAVSALVRSTFTLSAEQRQAIQLVSQEVFCSAGRFQFETSPDLISGIELSMDGHEVSWSIADYLCSLDKNVGDLLFIESSGEDQKKLYPGEKRLEAQNDPKPETGSDGHGQ
jgi:F-type H+-transporting ATPase subunit b